MRAASALSSACWRADCLPAYRAVQGVDQRLNLDELVAGPFGLVAVKGAASTFACVSRSSIMRSRAFFSVSSRSLILVSFNGGDRRHAAGAKPRRIPVQPPAPSINGAPPSIEHTEKARIARGLPVFLQSLLPTATAGAEDHRAAHVGFGGLSTHETSSFQLAITPVLVQTCVRFYKQPLIANDSSAAAYQPAGGYYG